jgi:hypothetical protein
VSNWYRAFLFPGRDGALDGENVLRSAERRGAHFVNRFKRGLKGESEVDWNGLRGSCSSGLDHWNPCVVFGCSTKLVDALTAEARETLCDSLLAVARSGNAPFLVVGDDGAAEAAEWFIEVAGVRRVAHAAHTGRGGGGGLALRVFVNRANGGHVPGGVQVKGERPVGHGFVELTVVEASLDVPRGS